MPFLRGPNTFQFPEEEIGAVPTTMNQKKIKVGTEEIQDEAIKCKHCGEFLSKLKPASKMPWYAKTSLIVLSFMTIGPLALPLVWIHPTYSQRKKILVTVMVLILTYFVGAVIFNSLKTIFSYYKEVGIF